MNTLCPRCNSLLDNDETVAEFQTCSSCGEQVPIDDSIGDPAPAVRHQQTVGKFRLIETVGEGAYGVVWKGEDIELGRIVAVKLLHSSLIARKTDAERFYREARAAAQLRHPGIVAVHEVAELDGTPAIISEFVEGVTLRQIISDRPLEFQETAILVAQVADALDYAHSLKVIHRDVKPGNIMVALQLGEGANTLFGSPESLSTSAVSRSASLSSTAVASRARLLDFGLALREEAEATLTTDGQVLGTPSYMSPEQATGDSHRVDRRSDVYSLGVVLYEMLTGEVPFKGPSVVVLRKVIGDEPRRPRELRRGIPRDLETICLKAMSKARDARYKTAGDFAADLRRFLTGEPIAAQPVGALGKMWRFCRRNPAIASSIGAIGVILLISSIVSISFALKSIEAGHEVERTLIDSYVSNGIQAAELGRSADSLVWFAAAHDRTKDDPIAQRENASRFWSFARNAPMPQRAIPGVINAKSMIVHPSGQFGLVRGGDELTLLDFGKEQRKTFPNGEAFCGAAGWTPAGDRIAIGSATGCTIFDFPSGENQIQLPDVAAVTALKFDPTGRYLALADSELKIWDCQEQRYSRTPFQLRSSGVELVFSQNGKFLAAVCDFDYCRVWSLASENEIELVYSPVKEPALKHELVNSRQRQPQFVGHDRYLIVCPDKFSLELIDTTTWLPARSIISAKEQPRANDWFCTNPDRSLIAVCFFDEVRIYDVESGAFIGEAMKHSNLVSQGSFSADGKTLMTSCFDRTCRFWSVPSGLSAAPPLFHQDSVNLAMFRPDDHSFITIQQDGLARVWSHEPVSRELPIGGGESYLAMSPDGKYCLGAGVNIVRSLRQPQLHRLDSFDFITSVHLDIGPAELNNAVFSTDSRRVVLLTRNLEPVSNAPVAEKPTDALGHVQWFDVVDGKRSREPIETPTEPIGASFSPDGKWLAVVCAGGQILTIDEETWSVTHRLFSEGSYPRNFFLRDFVRFFPSGSQFITWAMGTKARVWDAETGKQQYEIDAKELWFSDIQFSHCGKMFAAAAYNKTATVYDALSGEPLAPPLVHPDWVFTLQFSPDDKCLLTACRDGKGRLLDWRTGESLCSTMNHDDELFDVCFANEGRLILTACRGGSARVWNANNGKPISPPLLTKGYCYRVGVTPDNALLVLATQSDHLKVFALPRLVEPENITEASLMPTAEILSGSKMNSSSGVENLTSNEWLELWKDR